MSRARRKGWLLSVCLASLMLASAPSVALAQGGLIPADFFNAPVDPAAPTGVEADALTFEATTGIIRASGNVVLTQGGYRVSGDAVVYNRRTGDAQFSGATTVRDPAGNVAQTQDLVLTGGLKQTFLNALTINTYDGARITADSVEYDQAVETLLTEATYSPCGDCIDAQGRRVGWSVRAKSITYNREENSVYLEQPSLALLGMQVAWLPFLYLPDTSDTALANLPRPVVRYSEELGATITLPFKVYSTKSTDVIFSPTLMSRQGLMLSGEWRQRFDAGSFYVRGSGVYQLEPGAFAGTVGDRPWRGMIQSAGSFVPARQWTSGWSYTAFTDAAFLDDYEFETADATVNQLYATHVSDDTYFDARVQEFTLLGNVTAAQQDQQGANLPRVQFERVQELGEGRGRVEITGRLLGVHRAADAAFGVNGVPYTLGYAGNKQHAMFQAAWRNQYIAPSGVVLTPYLGGRADIAAYNGDSPSATAPAAATLLSATPIAAMDVRFPLAASDGSTVHLIEPIAQLVYRGSDTTAVGITNDDAQSFVADDTNLFSFNRFSGIDRQETGLRANIGGRYQVDFIDGSYLELIAGQSFQIAGANAFAATDPALTGVGSGFDANPSYAVLGAYGRWAKAYSGGGKLQLDTTSATVTRAGLEAAYTEERWSAALDYAYIKTNPALGVAQDQHEIGGEVGVTLMDYWRVTANTYWDLGANTWLQSGAGLTYDDGYLVVGASAVRTGPTHVHPNDTRFLATFRLKAPAGFDLGYSGAVPVTVP